VSLLAISKYQPIEALQEAYDAGQRMFGENHIQEMAAKAATLPKDIEWHFIGHLQKNKVKYIAPYVALIHGIDSYKLLAEVDKQAEKAGRVIPCLLQIHIAQEETKFGFSPDECMAMLDEGTWRTLTHVQIAGLMGMATYTDNHEQIIREFSTLSSLFRKLKETHFKDEPAFCELSMGMSGDYPLAISQGSTLIRIGSRIFGARQY
jgi:pyridoxal phosphate enzyme (YggS family)